MENTMTSSKFLPAELARRGELGLTRREVVRMSGRLFRLRVGIMLGGTVLDTPDWFWESEPELHELYSAVRGMPETIVILRLLPQLFFYCTFIVRVFVLFLVWVHRVNGRIPRINIPSSSPERPLRSSL